MYLSVRMSPTSPKNLEKNVNIQTPGPGAHTVVKEQSLYSVQTGVLTVVRIACVYVQACLIIYVYLYMDMYMYLYR